METNNPNYCSVDGVLFNKDTTTLIQFSLGRSGEYSIPTGVINIGDYAFYAAVNLTNVIIPESVIHIGEGTFISCGILSITIPNSVTSMGMSAFEDCFQLASVTIGENLTDIGDYAFSYCTALTSINNYSAMPQVICSGVFNKVDKSVCTLYVPAQSIALYQAADVWKEFIHILPIDAKPVDVTDVIVTPTETTADIAWPQVSGAYTYELVIKDQNGNVVCSQTFNAQGQLIDIVNTHARSRASRQTQSSGFQFTVIGLEKGTAYNYTIVSKDENGQVLDTQSGSFTTQSTQGINQITNYHTNKILHNGQIFILRGEKVYTLQGQEVK